MNGRWYHIMNSMLTAVLATVLLSACSAIDEDLSDCGNDYELEYELQLETNMQLELQTQLTTETEASVAEALQGHLKNIFSAFAHDIDLFFYEMAGTQELLYNESHVMDDNEKSYRLYLPMHEYRHLALANLQRNSWVKLTGNDFSNTLALQQVVDEPVKSHQTGIFAARTNMNVMEDMSQTFHVDLYMVNCAAVLLLEARGHDANDVSVVSTGFATGYNVNDNTYSFSDSSPLVHADQVNVGTDSYLCYCTVTFPSSDQPNPGLSSAADENTYWQFLVTVKNADGTTTETTLNIGEPLQAGQLKVVKAYIDVDGVVRTNASKVGVSVKIDWNNGGGYHSEL